MASDPNLRICLPSAFHLPSPAYPLEFTRSSFWKPSWLWKSELAAPSSGSSSPLLNLNSRCTVLSVQIWLRKRIPRPWLRARPSVCPVTGRRVRPASSKLSRQPHRPHVMLLARFTCTVLPRRPARLATAFRSPLPHLANHSTWAAGPRARGEAGAGKKCLPPSCPPGVQTWRWGS